MSFPKKLKNWDGYAWAEENGVQSASEAWSKLDRSDWMLRLAKESGAKLDEARLRLFACDCAEQVLPIFEGRYPEDDRPRLAIDTARRFARGEANWDELEADRDAAGAAAGSIILAVAAAKVADRKAIDAAAGDAAMAAATAAAGANDISDWAAWDAAMAAASAAAESIAADWDAAIADWHAAGAAKSAALAGQADKLRGYFKDPFR